jgi:hypothetical protein
MATKDESPLLHRHMQVGNPSPEPFLQDYFQLARHALPGLVYKFHGIAPKG